MKNVMIRETNMSTMDFSHGTKVPWEKYLTNIGKAETQKIKLINNIP